MDKNFIDKVKAIILDNLSDQNFGVRELSSLLHLSSSQTLRKIKAATGKSVNQYIRELRLEKAAKLIKETDLTASEIAFQVGFNSASYFNNTFNKYFGITPGEYKTRNINLEELTTQKLEARSRNNSKTKKLIYAIAATLLVLISYFLINNFTLNKNELQNSIAVLPFKDFSPEDNQWFSDGVSDNILHSLAQIKDISVISFTSSSTYRDSNKQIPEIAKELGVSYILEGSVTHFEDRIKIIVQLIDANDLHVWSKEYNEGFDDLISIQNNVAQEVMTQLRITLSPQEEVTLTKFPTENMEAYSLFLKGRLVNNSKRKDDLLNNIKLNKQAIELDSSFAEAYAEVAHSYWQLSRYHGFIAIDAFERRDLAQKYADSALNINPNSFRAWGVKAGLYEYVDWDKANAYYKKSLSINPNDALIHIQYAIYYQVRPKPDIKKHLEHLSISQKLVPISNLQAQSYLQALIFNHKINEAEEFLKKNSFQLNDFQIGRFERSIIAYKNKDFTKVIPYLKADLEKDPDNSLFNLNLAFAYKLVLNDDTAAIDYMKKAYKIDSLNISILIPYFEMLVIDKRYEEANKLMASENYNSVFNKKFKLKNLWYYHYLKEDLKETLEISKDTMLINDYLLQVLTYAQLGNRKKVDSINKKHPLGDRNRLKWRINRAILHAVLKDRDSMYYYLEKARFDGNVLYINTRREFEPYRQEERYKAFLRMNYLPVPKE